MGGFGQSTRNWVEDQKFFHTDKIKNNDFYCCFKKVLLISLLISDYISNSYSYLTGFFLQGCFQALGSYETTIQNEVVNTGNKNTNWNAVRFYCAQVVS